MATKNKYLVTDEGPIDLQTHVWDDELFSDRLISVNPINQKQALDVSRFIKDAINDLKIDTITLPVIDEFLKAKLMELGLKKVSTVKLEKSLFIKNGLKLSENAKTVLARRYLKKNLDG
ncbi:MAG: ribonucleotide-diphosphate reductase subunit alpha, partial [Deltaproteobacteria bacterium]|nr:ribonucleotide-diphosphate reductase subunit alpha [Deltaproteobacteria bacterium]